MSWDTQSNNLITKAQAILAIKAKASDEGIDGLFKVHYDGRAIVTDADLPDQVDMTLVQVSAVMDNA